MLTPNSIRKYNLLGKNKNKNYQRKYFLHLPANSLKIYGKKNKVCVREQVRKKGKNTKTFLSTNKYRWIKLCKFK